MFFDAGQRDARVPIANVYISAQLAEDTESVDRLIAGWSSHAGVSGEHMTINLIVRHAQVGSPFEIMAFLFLPTLWSDAQVESLQHGLARSLSDVYATDLASIQIVTLPVASGHAVTGGQTDSW